MISLMLNVGRTSIKYKLFNVDKAVKNSKVDQIGKAAVLNHVQAWEKLYQSLGVDIEDIEIVVHKLPYGGSSKNGLVKLTQEVVNKIDKTAEVYPFYFNEPSKVAILAMTVLPNAKHYAVFDDSFYSDLPEKVSTYPLFLDGESSFPTKTGGHGISHQYVSRYGQKELGMIRTQCTVSVHLGTNCSVCAIKDGQCIDVAGGFSSAEGLMGTVQSGDIDGGILLNLIKNGQSVDEIVKNISLRSGILGVSGVSDDMRDILYLAGYKVDDEKYIPPLNLPKDEVYINRARLAIDMFVYRIIRNIGSAIAVLGGIDCLAFTGTMGAGSSEIRSLILAGIGFIKDFEILVVEPNEEEEMKFLADNMIQAEKVS